MNSQVLPLRPLFFSLQPKDHSSPDDEESACVANIGPQQRRARLGFGIVMFAISIAIAAALILTGVDRGWRMGLFFPFYLAAVGFFQAHEKT